MEIASLVISVLTLIVDIVTLFFVSKIVNNVAQGDSSKAASSYNRGTGNNSTVIQR